MVKSIELKTKHIKYNANCGFTASAHINEVLKRIHETFNTTSQKYHEIGLCLNELKALAEKNNIYDIDVSPCVINWWKDEPDFDYIEVDITDVVKDLARAFGIRPVYLRLEDPVNYDYSYHFNSEKHRIEVFFCNYYNNDELDKVIPLSLEKTTICDLLISLNNAIHEESSSR